MLPLDTLGRIDNSASLEEQTREKTRLKSIEDEESKKIAVDINILERKVALDHCAALGFTLANTAGVDDIKPRVLGMKGFEVDFDAIKTAESRRDVKPKKANSRVNLGDAPDHAKAEYVSTGQRSEDGDPEDFIKLDVGEGQDFETLNYNHKLRRKLRRAIDSAEIRKEMLVRQRALEYYNEKNTGIPSDLTTSYKQINAKGQRILENGTLETAKQERVRARLELAEFNSQMRVLRKQAKEAAIFAGLRKHAELTGKIRMVEPLITQEEAVDFVPNDCHADCMSAPGRWVPSAASATATSMMTQSQNEIEDSTSSVNRSQLKQDSRATSTLNDPKFEICDVRLNKRHKDQTPYSDDSEANDLQSKFINSDRQAMIDAELALSEKEQRKVRQLPNNYSKPTVTNTDRTIGRNGVGTGANSWNNNGLPGNATRESKFLRLLGGG